MRKIIQIQALALAEPQLIALCNDGTLWQRALAPNAAWHPIEGIPDLAVQSEGEPAPTTGPTPTKPEAAGKRWLEIDDAELAERWCQMKQSSDQIAECMRRTEGAIIARLVNLDFFPDRDAAREEDQRRRNAAAACA